MTRTNGEENGNDYILGGNMGPVDTKPEIVVFIFFSIIPYLTPICYSGIHFFFPVSQYDPNIL